MPDGLWALLFGWVLVVQPVQAPTVVEPASAPRFPVVGATDFGRFHHDYPATDVFARCGTRVVSPADGTVLEVSRTDTWDPATDRGADRGGRSFSVRGADGVRYYGSHLSAVRPGLRAGTVLRAGDPVGRVGNSGDARGIACHLHFGLSPVCRGTGDWRVRRGVVPPYRFLRSWQRGGHLDPAPAVRRWRAAHGCRG
ncbi:M23 family metallopeptidase [Nocardioides panacis]|uniref:M23 family metallopeptidase n=1 Tax=Nocardioides panacis TaxID=2849501 RepID=A0A975SVM6_9ACTN|nr:M23 family metallopeptidase [Nocardioides panacis]QWZ06745.1 M23 family metallopeptidase [Nocardioides panacis]